MDTMGTDCTIYQTANFVGKKWTLVILLELYRGKLKKKRYSVLKNNIPEITPKLLSARLKELEKEGLVKKEVDAKTFPIKCEYSLTKRGRDFINVIKHIKKWTLKWDIENPACEKKDCKDCIF